MPPRDWPNTDQLVELAATASTTEAFRKDCLELMSAAVGCDAALMQTACQGAPMLRGGTWNFDYGAMQHIGANLARYQVEMAPLLREVMRSSVAVDVDVLGVRGVRELSITREAVAPQGLGQAAIVALPVGTFGATVNLVFLRAGHARPFEAATIEALRRSVRALTLCELAVSKKEAEPPDFTTRLSPAEWGLVEWVRLGYSNEQIGLACDVSAFTVRNRLMRLYKKLGVGSRTEMLYAVGVTRRTLPH